MKIIRCFLLFLFLECVYTCKIFCLKPNKLKSNININNVIVNLNNNAVNSLDKNYLTKENNLNDYLLTNLTIVDDNDNNYNSYLNNTDLIRLKNKKVKIQRVLSDIDINQKNLMIISNYDVIEIMNKWNYSLKKSPEIDGIFKFLFMFFYINRNIKKNIGIFNYNNICECLLFYEYKFDNGSYILYLKKKIINPYIENITLLKDDTLKIYDYINNKILNYTDEIYNNNINNINNIINNI